MINQRMHWHSNRSFIIEISVFKILFHITFMSANSLSSRAWISNTKKSIVLTVKCLIEMYGWNESKIITWNNIVINKLVNRKIVLVSVSYRLRNTFVCLSSFVRCQNVCNRIYWALSCIHEWRLLKSSFLPFFLPSSIFLSLIF